MGKRRKGFKPQDVTIMDSDDERAYTKIQDPEPDSRDFIYDDIDEFHAGRDKVLLQSGVGYYAKGDSDEQEEVLSVLSDDDLLSDEDMSQYRSHLLRYKRQKIKEKMGSDLEDENDASDKKEKRGWGKKRSQFYGADFDEFVDLSGSDDDQKKAILEEKEALDIQKKMLEDMDEDDFGLDEFKKPDKNSDGQHEKNEEQIVKDLSKLSKRERLELLQKESPELLTLIEDFKEKLGEIKYTIQPLFKLVQDGKIVDRAAGYVTAKFHLNLSYCVNISFYLMLKAKRIPTINHPVIKRLVQYRKLIKEIEPVDIKLKKDVNDILTTLKRGEEVNFVSVSPPIEKLAFKRRQIQASVRERVEERRKAANNNSDLEPEQVAISKTTGKRKKDSNETDAEKKALEFYDMLKNKKTRKAENNEDEVDLEKAFRHAAGEYDVDEMGDEDKRAITNQIQKNRGLTPSRKRELKNPRVRHRHKFRKANIRRKGQIREVRTEIHRYGGEMTGIRAGIKRGRKLK